MLVINQVQKRLALNCWNGSKAAASIIHKKVFLIFTYNKFWNVPCNFQLFGGVPAIIKLYVIGSIHSKLKFLIIIFLHRGVEVGSATNRDRTINLGRQFKNKNVANANANANFLIFCLDSEKSSRRVISLFLWVLEEFKFANRVKRSWIARCNR